MASTTKVLFPWKSEYCVQHSGIDGQHQGLVELVNDLYAAMSGRRGRTAVNRILIGLTEHTKAHFSYEEQQMERVAYPGILQHKAFHCELLEEIERYVNAWSYDQSADVVELAAFLKDWLLDHIGNTDRPLAEYLSARR
jgi:hemerythrin